MRGKIYVCDDCGAQDKFTSYVKARAAKWAVSKDYEKCYCPTCAPNHRRGGASVPRVTSRAELPAGAEQLSIAEI